MVKRMSDNSWYSFFKKKAPVWKKDPVVFFKEVLGFNADQWQKEVAYSVRDNPRTAVKSGQGVGKTGNEACILLWFLLCYQNARIVCTAPTKQQLHDVLWPEIDKWMSMSPLLPTLMKWTKTYVYMIGYEKRWFAVARTATRPENMQGYHEDNMLFIVDEASGVADPIMEAITGTLSGPNNKLLMMGNPTKTSGTFYDAFTADRDIYKCFTVNSEDSPRTNKENIRAMKRKYGAQSNVVLVRVYGEFPKQEDDVFLPLGNIEQSIKTEMSQATALALGEAYDSNGNKLERDPSGVEKLEIACDVARFGDDKTVIGYRVNEKMFIYKKYNGQDTNWTASNLRKLYLRLKEYFMFTGSLPIKIDDGGVGGGVTDQLRSFKRSDPALYDTMSIIPVNFGRPIHHKYYADSTTYMMGCLRDMISTYDEEGNAKKCDVILPNDDDLVGELSVRKYGFTSNGKQQVESKKAMKERGLHSPDEGDCILLLCLPVIRKRGEKKK